MNLDKIFKSEYLSVFIVLLSALLLNDTYHGDPNIYLIYAKNIALGDFFSFNPNEFSSGSTSPLWALILGVFYYLTDSHISIKIASLIFMLLASLSVIRTLRVLTQSQLVINSALFILYFYLLSPGLMGYESALIVLLISEISRILLKYNFNFKLFDLKSKLFIGLLIAALPLVRPDSAIIAIILFVFFISKKGNFLNSFLIFGLSTIPSLLFFGYSYFETSTFSSSSYCRSFALSENAIEVLGFAFSKEAILHFISLPMFYLFFTSLAVFDNKSKYKEIIRFGILVFIAYYILITFISPIAWDVKRYLIPAVAALMIPFAIGLDSLLLFINSKKLLALRYLVIVLCFFPLIYAFAYNLQEFSKDLFFDVIMEKQLAEQINLIAEENSTVLAYEVQIRYYLKDDISVLSLDGITDGKVAPYLESGDMLTFIKEYTPDYWIANGAVNYREFLQNSILNEVEESFKYEELEYFEIDGVRFEKILENEYDYPKGFAGFTNLYKINYLE